MLQVTKTEPEEFSALEPLQISTFNLLFDLKLRLKKTSEERGEREGERVLVEKK